MADTLFADPDCAADLDLGKRKIKAPAQVGLKDAADHADVLETLYESLRRSAKQAVVRFFKSNDGKPYIQKVLGEIKWIAIDGAMDRQALLKDRGETTLVARMSAAGGRVGTAMPIFVEWKRSPKKHGEVTVKITPDLREYDLMMPR